MASPSAAATDLLGKGNAVLDQCIFRIPEYKQQKEMHGRQEKDKQRSRNKPKRWCMIACFHQGFLCQTKVEEWAGREKRKKRPRRDAGETGERQ